MGEGDGSDAPGSARPRAGQIFIGNAVGEGVNKVDWDPSDATNQKRGNRGGA